MTDAEFQRWLSSMDDGLREFFEELPDAVSSKLDYSIDSLDVLEAWLLERYPTFEAGVEETEAPIIDGAGRYIGETFRKHAGGRWSIERNNLFAGFPVITDFGGGIPECPHTSATASLDRREGDYISSSLRNTFVVQAAYKRMRSRTRASAERDFQAWLATMDDVLEAFLEQLPESVAAKLDYSMESLDVLEAWLLERYPAGEAADAIIGLVKRPAFLDPATVPPILDAVGRYVGETFRKQVGGRWWLDIDLEKFFVYGELPLIIEFSPEPAPICPLTAALDSLETREGQVISGCFRGIRDEIPILRAHLQKA